MQSRGQQKRRHRDSNVVVLVSNIIPRSGQSKEDLIDSEDGDVTDLVVRYSFESRANIDINFAQSRAGLHGLSVEYRPPRQQYW